MSSFLMVFVKPKANARYNATRKNDNTGVTKLSWSLTNSGLTVRCALPQKTSQRTLFSLWEVEGV